jgi:neutral ceramidase
MPNTFLIGTGKYDITGSVVGSAMIGMSKIGQVTEGIHTRLFSRAFIIAEGNDASKRVAIAVCDIWSCTIAVKKEVVKRLKEYFGDKYTDENVLVTGTHTHSGAGGYSYYPLYISLTGGFDKQNFECIVNGIVESIKIADGNLKPCQMELNKGSISDCGQNRSIEAYNNNPEEEKNKYNASTDNEMIFIRFKNGNNYIGSINWYPIHPTSLGETNKFISGDNKGLASYYFESSINRSQNTGKDFIAAFANSNCGDVSGNVKYGKPPEGKDDFIRMVYYATKLYNQAMRLIKTDAETIEGKINYCHTYINMSNISISNSNYKTYPAALGISVLGGSSIDSTSQIPFIKEGIKKGDIMPPIVTEIVQKILDMLVQVLTNFEHPDNLEDEFVNGQGNKLIAVAAGLTKPYSLVADILPIQIFTIGNIAILGIPGEITTMAGRRLKKQLQTKLADAGIKHVILCGYSNAYSGYITTKEEYDMQYYEGASTYYGPYTLMAYQQEFTRLADSIINGTPPVHNIAPIDLASVFKDAKSEKHGLDGTGLVFVDANNSYKKGESVEVKFIGTNPFNDPRTNDTFLRVEKNDNGNWKTVFTDNDPYTFFHWEAGFISSSILSIKWQTYPDTEPGEYRISYFGNKKDSSQIIGRSKVFQITDN